MRLARRQCSCASCAYRVTDSRQLAACRSAHLFVEVEVLGREIMRLML